VAVLDVSAPLPDLILPPGATITVTMDDANAKVTKLNVYGYSPTKVEPIDLLPPILVHEHA